MSDDEQRPTGATAVRRSRGAVGPALTIVLAVLAVLVALAEAWTRFLWFDSLGRRSVLERELLVQGALFAAAAVTTGALVASGLVIGHRTRPVYAPVSPEQLTLDRYRTLFEPLRRLLLVAVPTVLAALAGVAAASQWQLFLRWWYRHPFGTVDAHFGKDVGFFVFELPWWQLVTDLLLMIVMLATFVAAATHYVYGGLRIGPGARSSRPAMVHLSVLLAALALLQALRYWLDRYALAVLDTGRITGITYTADHALLPGKAILAAAAVVCALLFLAAARASSWRLPVVAVGLLAVCALVIGSIYPALVQSLRVQPSQQTLEAPYVEQHLAATRAAFGLSSIVRSPATPTGSDAALSAAAGALAPVPVVDPAVVGPAFEALQAKRKYYTFATPLDVDRYPVDGRSRQVVVGVRELSLDKMSGPRSWVNDHMAYTHGIGVVGAYVDDRAADGSPSFVAKDLPPTGLLGSFEPRIYFGESSPEYSVVGGAGGQREVDYPDGSAAGQATTTYAGAGGVGIGSLARRLAYAVTYREPNLLLSDEITEGSRILDHRTPAERVQRLAPWLTLDQNPYPVVVKGRVLWVVDGYTTSSTYPGAQLTDLDAAREDGPEAGQPAFGLPRNRVNYLRNAVKATVDAFDGTVHLYAWDEQDPILATWSDAFPGTVEPMSAISGELMAHLRYPQDMFRVQRAVLARYHVGSAAAFLNEGDVWQVSPSREVAGAPGARSATSPVAPTTGVQPPVYLPLAMPGERDARYSLTSTFTASGREYMAALLAVDSDAGTATGRRRPGYGTLRLLELPQAARAKSPDVATASARSATFSGTLRDFINLSSTGGSKVRLGEPVTVPLAGGLLSVQSIYVQPASGTSYPQLKAVAVSLGDKVAWSDSLSNALVELTGGATPDDPAPAEPTPTPAPTGTQPPATTVPDAPGAAGAVARAQQAMKDADAALARRDFAAYGEAQDRLRAALTEAGRLLPQASAPTPAASASGTPTG